MRTTIISSTSTTGWDRMMVTSTSICRFVLFCLIAVRLLSNALTIICLSRYLILDILGQGTFGQVVKCQNMKTHEVVAVKVVKNKPAYFNQSMMEVTILELVRRMLVTPVRPSAYFFVVLT